jgi:hypothetical protein
MLGTNWQPEEDERLLEFLANGISWKEISRALPGRSEGSCMERYRILQSSYGKIQICKKLYD